MSRAARSPSRADRGTLFRAWPGRALVAGVCGFALLGGMLTGAGAGSANASVATGSVVVRGGIVSAPASVHGSGATGRVMVPVTPTTTGAVGLTLSGLAPGVVQSDPASTGYRVDVAPGTRWARFDLAADGAPVDVVVTLDTNAGAPLRWASEAGAPAGESSSAGGRVDIADPAPGSYRVTPAAPTDDTVLTSYAPPTGVITGAFTANPSALAARSQVTSAYALTWSGLDAPAPYLGVIDYRAADPAPGEPATAGVATVITVDTGTTGGSAPGDGGGAAVAPGTPPGAASATPGAPATGSVEQPPARGTAVNPVNSSPPLITGTPSVGRVLHAHAGQWSPDDLDVAFRWQADGVDIPGATGPRFLVMPAQAGAVLTVVVTATRAGLAPALARSSGMLVSALAEVTVSTNHRRVAPGKRVTLTMTVDSPEAVTGPVTVRVDSERFTVQLRDGVGTVRFRSTTPGSYRVVASYPGSDTVSAARSAPLRFRVTG